MSNQDHFSFLYKTTYCKRLASWLKRKNKVVETTIEETKERQTKFKENTNSIGTSSLPLDTFEMELEPENVTKKEIAETTSRKGHWMWGHWKSSRKFTNMTSYPRKGTQINVLSTATLLILLTLIPAGLAQYPNLPGM